MKRTQTIMPAFSKEAPSIFWDIVINYFHRSGNGGNNPYKVDNRPPREGIASSTRGRSPRTWTSSRGRGTGAKVRITPKKSANERLLKKPNDPEVINNNDPKEMQDLTTTMGNVKLNQRQFEPRFPGENCICMRPLKYVRNYLLFFDLHYL